MANPRDVEVMEAIKRDDLAYVLTTRSEKVLEHLCLDETEQMLTFGPSPLMTAAFYGATKCFDFFLKNGNIDYVDYSVSFLFLVDRPSISLPLVEIQKFFRL